MSNIPLSDDLQKRIAFIVTSKHTLQRLNIELRECACTLQQHLKSKDRLKTLQTAIDYVEIADMIIDLEGQIEKASQCDGFRIKASVIREA